MSTKDKLLPLGFFLFFTPVLIFTELALLVKVNYFVNDSARYALVGSIAASAEENKTLISDSVFSSSDYRTGFVKESVIAGDARPILIKNYLKKYHSPLSPYAGLIFRVSQDYGLDYRLITAIAQQESNLCKKAPPNCFNCWGVGIHSRGTMCFDSYPKAIEWVAKYLREEYYDKGRTTPEEIMKKFCPLSDGSWAFGVRQFMEELE